MTAIKTVNDLKVYQEAHRLAMKVFEMTKNFPKDEVHSLTDQIRISSRSAAINIREGYGKRKYQGFYQTFDRRIGIG